MKIAILDAATLGEDLDLSPFRRFGDVAVYQATLAEEVALRVENAECVIVNKIRLGEENLKNARCLRLICVAATGYDNIDLGYCRANGIAVCNVVGYSAGSVSQLTVAMALSLACHLPAYRECVSSGEYSRGKNANRLVPVYHELSGKTWGIFGYGAIGRRVGDVARALGCRVLYTRASEDKSPDCVSLDQLCRESDILSLHSPLTEKTRGVISDSRLRMMKKDAILINVSRGAVTNEAAVAEAILEGRLGGFGCDVYSCEPFGQEHPYHAIASLPNVCLTPHMAWGAYEARERCRDEMVENIAAFLRGEARSRVEG